jgi:dolichol kinase
MRKFIKRKNKNLIKSELKIELYRKIFHLLIAIPAVIYYLCDLNLLKVIMIPAVILLTTLDYFNIYYVVSKFKPLGFLAKIMREHEKLYGKLSGSTWVFISILFLVYIADNKDIAVISLLVLAVSDTCAALLGMRFGRKVIKRNFFGKSIEGSAAFFSSGLLVIFLYLRFFSQDIHNINQLLWCLGFSTIVELISKSIKIDDNFSITLSFVLAYKITLFFS